MSLIEVTHNNSNTQTQRLPSYPQHLILIELSSMMDMFDLAGEYLILLLKKKVTVKNMSITGK